MEFDWRLINRIFTGLSVLGAVGSFLVNEQVEKANMDDSVKKYLDQLPKKD